MSGAKGKSKTSINNISLIMKKIILDNVGTIKINSFHPLCCNEFGLNAIRELQLPPFIDASCRREPDLENPFPSISALCRQSIFAPHLHVNDIVVYITVQGKYPNDITENTHHRLIAILQVIEACETHLEASEWYRSHNLPIPSNCMIPDNPPKRFEETASRYNTKKEIRLFLSRPIETQRIIGVKIIEKWNDEYIDTSLKWPKFLITNTIFKDYNNPPIILDEHFISIFGRTINTETPNIISLENLVSLGKIAGLNINIKN
jgi:hypothetical protein